MELTYYELSDFAVSALPTSPSAKKNASPAHATTAPRTLGPINLDDHVKDDRLKATIVTGIDPDDPSRFPSRSEAGISVAVRLVAAKVPENVIFEILMDPRFAVGAYLRDKRRPEEAVLREIESAVAFEAKCFETDGNGFPLRNSQRNIEIALREMGVSVAHNDMSQRLEVRGLERHGPNLDDNATAVLLLRLEREHGVRATDDYFNRVLRGNGLTHRYDPVRNYLASLPPWDGVPRVCELFTRYAGAEPSEYVRDVALRFLVGAVRRVMQPGCKHDTMVTLEGPQGCGKSTFLLILAIKPEWYGDQVPISESAKELIEAIGGKWIIEWAELAGHGKKDVEIVKAVLSRQVDESRMSYDRHPKSFPRRSIFVGSVNPGGAGYYRDTTGNRRFHPVAVGKIDLDALREDVHQIWAEAVLLEAQGVSNSLDPKLYEVASIEQEERVIVDPYYDVLNGFLRDLQGRIKASDVWLMLGKLPGHRAPTDNQRVGEAMRLLGFQRKKLRIEGHPQNAYWRGDGNLRIYVHCEPNSPVPHEVSNNEFSERELERLANQGEENGRFPKKF